MLPEISGSLILWYNAAMSQHVRRYIRRHPKIENDTENDTFAVKYSRLKLKLLLHS